MKKHLQTKFSHRQSMLSQDFEIYYYNDCNLSKVEPHAHDYYEFYFFLEGDAHMQIWQDSYPLSFGDILLIPPGTPHLLINHDQQTPYRRIILWISQNYCQHLQCLNPDFTYFINYLQEKHNFIIHNDRISFNTIQSMILRLLEEIHGTHFGREAQISVCINDLILHMSRIVYERNHIKTYCEETSLFLNVKNYIENHLNENLSLDTLAEIFYVSKYHIAHLFKEQLGISIHQYITKKRLSLCKEAILSRMNITKAFLTYGFKDYSSFYRAFKKEYGVSPKEFLDMQTIKID